MQFSWIDIPSLKSRRINEMTRSKSTALLLCVLIACLLSVFLLYRHPATVAKYDKISKEERRNYAVIGATSDPIYLFPLPITVEAWKVLGVETIACFAGTRQNYTENPQAALVLRLLEEQNVQMIFLDTKLAPIHTVSQTCRMYVASSPELSIPDDSVLITSDSDLWPFHLRDHIPDEKIEQTMFLYNSMCCGMTSKNGKRKYRMYPMSTIAMSAKLWRHIMNVEPGFLRDGDVLANRLYEEFNIDFIRNGTGKPHISDSWFADQILVSEKIDNYLKEKKGNQARIGELKQVAPVTRLDRSRWRTSMIGVDLNNYHDAHILHPLHESKNWHLTMPLLDIMFKTETSKLFDDYHTEFVSLGEINQ